MKRSLFSALLLGIAFISNAQSTTFKPFKFDLTLGYAVPEGSGAKGGLIIAGEPKYAINDNITLGLRMETALMLRKINSTTGYTEDYEVKGSGSYVVTGDCYFTTTDFRPFAGAGAGLFRTAATTTASTTENVTAANKFGGMGRAGFEYGHFRLAVEYNLLGKTDDYSNSYVGVKLGFFFGGGRVE